MIRSGRSAGTRGSRPLPSAGAGDWDLQVLVERLRAMTPAERTSETGRSLAGHAYSDLHTALLRRPRLEEVYRFALPFTRS